MKDLSKRNLINNKLYNGINIHTKKYLGDEKNNKEFNNYTVFFSYN